MLSVILAILGGCIISAFISGIFYLIAKRTEKPTTDTDQNIKLAVLNKGIQMLLLGELERQANKYTGKMSITKEERQWFLEVYEAYKATNGNGYADDMCHTVLNLEIVG